MVPLDNLGRPGAITEPGARATSGQRLRKSTDALNPHRVRAYATSIALTNLKSHKRFIKIEIPIPITDVLIGEFPNSAASVGSELKNSRGSSGTNERETRPMRPDAYERGKMFDSRRNDARGVTDAEMLHGMKSRRSCSTRGRRVLFINEFRLLPPRTNTPIMRRPAPTAAEQIATHAKQNSAARKFAQPDARLKRHLLPDSPSFLLWQFNPHFLSSSNDKLALNKRDTRE